ncbi:MAG: M23 family metallopeptidase [Elusimicrobia bacterium]|nr:M23 family metallopeptidase [Elusimicrobiota bacterium]
MSIRRLFYLVQKALSQRYTILMVPHRGGRSRSFSIGLTHGLVILSAWCSMTVLGAGFFTQRSAWTLDRIQARLYQTQVRALAQEVRRMREQSRGMAYLESDLRLMMAKNDPADVLKEAMALVERDAVSPREDTLSSLLLGKISQAAVEKIRLERQSFEQQSLNLLGNASGLLLRRFDHLNRIMAVPSDWPTMGSLTSRFGLRLNPFDPMEGDGKYHHGVDIANNEGTPIRVAANGIVRRCGWVNGYGRTVVIDHGYGYSTLYGHNSKIMVNEGDYVRRGDLISYMGTTGRSTGSHLHFEVWQHGRPVDPLRFVRYQNLAESRDRLALGVFGGDQEALINAEAAMEQTP